MTFENVTLPWKIIASPTELLKKNQFHFQPYDLMEEDDVQTCADPKLLSGCICTIR